MLTYYYTVTKCDLNVFLFILKKTISLRFDYDVKPLNSYIRNIYLKLKNHDDHLISVI